MSLGDIQQAAGSSAGKQLDFGPTAVEQNGVLQRQLQPSPQMGAQSPQMPNRFMGAAQGLLSAPQQQPPMPGGAGAFQAPASSTDPNLAATMQGLQGLLAASRAKKEMLAKAMMGG